MLSATGAARESRDRLNTNNEPVLLERGAPCPPKHLFFPGVRRQNVHQQKCNDE